MELGTLEAYEKKGWKYIVVARKTICSRPKDGSLGIARKSYLIAWESVVFVTEETPYTEVISRTDGSWRRPSMPSQANRLATLAERVALSKLLGL